MTEFSTYAPAFHAPLVSIRFMLVAKSRIPRSEVAGSTKVKNLPSADKLLIRLTAPSFHTWRRVGGACAETPWGRIPLPTMTRHSISVTPNASGRAGGTRLRQKGAGAGSVIVFREA